MFALGLLRIIPDRTDNLRIRGDLVSSDRLVIHPVGVMLVQLSKFGCDPLVSVRSAQTRAASVFLAMGHCGSVGGGDHQNWVGQIPSMEDVMNDEKLIERDLRERGILIFGLWSIRGNEKGDRGLNGKIERF
jgi:hypothetical protein